MLLTLAMKEENDSTVARCSLGTTACKYACSTGWNTPLAAIATRYSATALQKVGASPTPIDAPVNATAAPSSIVDRRPQNRVRRSTSQLPSAVASEIAAAMAPRTHGALDPSSCVKYGCQA